MTLQELYTAVGGNYDDVISRLYSERIIQKMILKYPVDLSYSDLILGILNDDRQAVFQAAHTLKGIAGNLAFGNLYEASSALTEQMRSLSEPANAALVKRVTEAHRQTLQAIAAYQKSL